MLKRILTLTMAAMLGCFFHADAQTNADNLRFGQNREFKILQVGSCTDNSGNISPSALDLIGRQISIEGPQLVVFTLGANGAGAAATVLPAAEKICGDVPFAIVSGDDNANVALPVKSANGSAVEHVVYLINGDPSFEEVAWYRQQSKKFAGQNAGRPMPSTAFLYKPLPEYQEAFSEFGGQKMLKKTISHTGNKRGDISCRENNTGLFTSMHECGDVAAVFSAYDEDNDFALAWKNIMLAYGRNSKADGSSPFGVRVIIINESGNNLLTYIRNENNEVIDKCSFPDEFTIIK